MALEIFTGTHLPTLLSTIRTALGPDACVVQLRRRGTTFELIASDTPASSPLPVAEMNTPMARPVVPTVDSKWSRPDNAPRAPEFHDVLSHQLSKPARAPIAAPVPAPVAAPARPDFMPRPWFVALVGPTGAGKTTTIAKLATSAHGFAGTRVGLLGLDTYRVGAAEQLTTYGELADLPCEVVYSDAELPGALKRLSDCEVVLVDTPGRGPRNADDAEIVRGWLQEIAADEVHLVLPAGQLPALSRRLLRAFAPFRCTHLLATKLDEYPVEAGIFDLALEHAHPMRWVTDGQAVPADIRLAADLLGAARERRRAGTRTLEPVA